MNGVALVGLRDDTVVSYSVFNDMYNNRYAGNNEETKRFFDCIENFMEFAHIQER